MSGAFQACVRVDFWKMHTDFGCRPALCPEEMTGRCLIQYHLLASPPAFLCRSITDNLFLLAEIKPLRAIYIHLSEQNAAALTPRLRSWQDLRPIMGS